MTSFNEIQQLAEAIATDGIKAVSQDRLRALAAEAVQVGASPVLAAVLADPTQPAPARTRAFGRVATAFLFTDLALTIAA